MKIVYYCVTLGLFPLFTLTAQAPASWVPVGTASVSDLAANANGALWAIASEPRTSADKPVLKWAGNAFAAQSMSAKRIAVDPQGNPWIVTSAGVLSHWTTRWEDATLKAMDVAVGANGAVWAVGTDYRISQLVDGTWKAISGAASRIAVDPRGNPWVVNAGGQIWRWNGTGWALLSGAAQDISISSDGNVFIVSTKAIPGGFEIQQWNGSGWTAVPGAGGAVIATGQKLYIALHGVQGSLVYATNYPPNPTTTTTATSTPITLEATSITLPPSSPTSTGTATTGSVTLPPSTAISVPMAGPKLITPPPTTTTTPAPPASTPTVITGITGTLVEGAITNPTPATTTTDANLRVQGMLKPLAAPIPGALICPIIVEPMRLQKGCALYGDRAAYVAKAPSTTCTNGSFADPQNGGECWTCPATYVRNVSPVTSKDACWKPIGETLSRATRVGKLGCQVGFFNDPRNGGECWQCPAGFNRTLDPVTAERACSKGIFGPFSRATSGAKPVQACAAPAFGDPIDGGTCWTCPATYRRTANSVTSDGACAKTYETQYSVATQQNGCSTYPTPVGYGTPFRDPRNGGECWACPVPLLRSAAAVNTTATGNSAACHAGGNTDRLVWQSPQYPEPGLLRFMPGLIEMVFANPKLVDQYLMIRAGGDPGKKRALWAAMINDPVSSAELKALMFAALLTAAKNDVGGFARQSVAEFESYARARRVFVAEEAVRMYDAWQGIDGYNQWQEARRASGIMGISSSVLGAAATDYQEYAWTAAAPDSAGVEFVSAFAALSGLGESLPPSTFNNNNPSFQLQYLQPVSFAIGNALETLTQKGGQQINKAASLSKVLAGGVKQLGANAFFVVLTLVNAGIEIGSGINILTEKDKLAGEYAKLVTEANTPVSVKAMLDSKDAADAQALLLFWSLATSPSSANAKLSQGKISGSSLCGAGLWNQQQCAFVKSLTATAAQAAAAMTMGN